MRLFTTTDNGQYSPPDLNVECGIGPDSSLCADDVAYFPTGLVYNIFGRPVFKTTEQFQLRPLYCKHCEDPYITHWNISKKDIYRIDMPNVRMKKTEYPSIKFTKGDQVKIEAGGCAQRGGLSSNTWARYVDPLTSDGKPASLYYGTVYIPGANDKNGTLSQIEAIRDIPDGLMYVNTNTDLWLGYADDDSPANGVDYPDNGYDSHDDGDAGQCHNVGPAWVVLTVTHGTYPPLINWKPFDIAWKQNAGSGSGWTIQDDMAKFDDNFILKNPYWGLEVSRDQFGNTKGHPDIHEECGKDVTEESAWAKCTNQNPKFDLGSLWEPSWWNWLSAIFIGDPFPGQLNSNGFICYLAADKGVPYGHVNYAPITYEGYITWEHKTPAGADDDYNLNTVQNTNLILKGSEKSVDVYGNPKGNGMEFDSDETIDHFHTYWWEKQLRWEVDNFGDEGAHSLMDDKDGGRYAIVTGLAGIDAQHNGPVELHPVYAMAIKLGSASPSEEYWAMFVRNWGDEGFCSQSQHYLDNLPGDTYTFRIPWKIGATDVDVVWGENDAKLDTFFYVNENNPPPVEVRKSEKHDGVQVVFKLTSPHKDGTRYNGQLHLHWIFPQGSVQAQAAQSQKLSLLSQTTSGPTIAQNSDTSDTGIEDYLETLYNQLTPQQQSTLLANLPKKDFTPDENVVQPTDAVWVSQFQGLLPGQTFKSPTERSEIDNDKLAKDKQKINAWVTAFGGADPFIRAFISVSAKASASRTIENQIVHAGDSINVAVAIKSNISQSLSLNETLPPGWTMTQISNGDADAFDPTNIVWSWSNIGAGVTKIVTYRINVPPDAEAKTYYIKGTFTDNTEIPRAVSGDNYIKVVAEVRGMKWEDHNGNGIRDPEDQGLAGWKINLKGANAVTSKEVNMTATTDANGSYSFVNLSSGTYIISETLQSGWKQIAPATGSYSVNITNGTMITRKDFGNKQYSIYGMKFNDKDGNGKRDMGEEGLIGWHIRLIGVDTLTMTPVNREEITDANGNYRFMDVNPGIYQVFEMFDASKAGWVPTTSVTVPIVSKEAIKGINVDFGNRRIP